MRVVGMRVGFIGGQPEDVHAHMPEMVRDGLGGAPLVLTHVHTPHPPTRQSSHMQPGGHALCAWCAACHRGRLDLYCLHKNSSLERRAKRSLGVGGWQPGLMGRARKRTTPPFW